MKRVGIIGGLGPDTTAQFYLDIIRKHRYYGGKGYPEISIYSVPLLFCVEEEIVKNSVNEEKLLPYLHKAVHSLEKNVDFIAIPCNTAHIYIDELRHLTKIPIISMVEETAVAVRSAGLDNIGILATAKTVESNLYGKVFENMGLRLITPDPSETRITTEVIYNLLMGSKDASEKEKLKQVMRGLKEKGADALILGCTDLQLILDESDFDLPVFDSYSILTDAVIKRL